MCQDLKVTILASTISPYSSKELAAARASHRLSRHLFCLVEFKHLAKTFAFDLVQEADSLGAAAATAMAQTWVWVTSS